MSRASIIRVFLGIVLAALCVTVWQVLSGPGDSRPQVQPEGNENVSSKVHASNPSSEVSSDVSKASPLKEDGLLKTLPAPQSPPAKLNALGKKKWLEDLMELIDDASYMEDEASLRMLIVEFRNPEPGIAAAARESLLSRADKKALPYLLEMQELDLKADTKRQIEEMIGFLKKQSVFEHMRSKDL